MAIVLWSEIMLARRPHTKVLMPFCEDVTCISVTENGQRDACQHCHYSTVHLDVDLIQQLLLVSDVKEALAVSKLLPVVSFVNVMCLSAGCGRCCAGHC